jgi:cathepsin D
LEIVDGKPLIFKNSFGGGYLYNYFAKDVCYLGDYDRIVINAFNFGLVTTTTLSFNNFDALVGMAYPAMAYKDYIPMFDRMIEQNTFGNNMFAFYLSLN